MHSIKVDSGFCVIIASLSRATMSGLVFTRFTHDLRVVVSIIIPDSRFSNFNGGHPMGRPCACWRHVPTEAKRILGIWDMHSCTAATSSVVQANCSRSVGVSCSDIVSSSDISRSLLWDSGASDPPATLELKDTVQATLHVSPCSFGLRLQFCVFAAQARPFQSRCPCRDREGNTGLLQMPTGSGQSHFRHFLEVLTS